MNQLNLHHLYYFWVVAKEGSIAKACPKLYLTQPAISTQIMQLEKSLGKKLFERSKKRLHLTPEGTLALDYANHIFSASQELWDALRDRPTPTLLTVQIGLVDQVSKQVARKMMRSILQFRPQSQMTVREGTLEFLLEELQKHAIDIVLSDADVPVKETGDYVKAEVGRLPALFVGAPSLARLIKTFPKDLSKVPFILPSRTSPIRMDVERFLNRHHIEPRVLAEVQDVELLRLMALDGQGITMINQVSVWDDLKSGRLKRLGRQKTGITEMLWLITRKRHHPNPIAEHLLTHFKFSLT
jgi:LysR family transcriptional activator of nhaA